MTMLKDHFKKTPIESIVFIAIILFIIVTPNSYFFTFDKKRIFEVGIVFLNLIILSNRDFRGRLASHFYIFSLSTRLALFTMLILGILSSIYAPLSRCGFLELSLYVGLFVISMTIFCLSVKYENLFDNVLIVLLIASCVMYQTSFFSLYLAASIQKVPVHWPLLFTSFENVRFFNQYQIWLFFLISYPLLNFKELDSRLRVSLKTIAIAWAILLIYSGSRGACIALISALIISWFCYKKKSYSFIKLNLYFLFAGALGAWLLFDILPLFFGAEFTTGWRTFEQLTTDSPRLYLINLCLSHIKAHPLLGIGPMHLAYYPNPISSYLPYPIFSHPHNSILQWATEMGVPSAIIILLLIGKGLVLWIKRFRSHVSDQQSSYLGVVLLSTVCSAIIYSLVDGVIVMPVSQVLMAVIMGWMFGIYFRTNKIFIEEKENIAVLLFAGAVLIMLTYTIVPGLLPRMAGVAGFSTREHSVPNDPRFWVQGQIPD